MKKVLITGATGLLGKSLVEVGMKRNFTIVAQYHRRKPPSPRNCQWLQADFSRPEGLQAFLEKNRGTLRGCRYLINNYGPINPKPVSRLVPADFHAEFHHNTLTALEIMHHLIREGALESVVSIGFENLGKVMAFRDVLPYAIAKNALLLITTSYDRHYRDIRFNMVSPATLIGAREKRKKGPRVSPPRVAEKIYDTMTGKRGGLHVTVP